MCGLNSGNMQMHLLSTKDPALKHALETAQVMEEANNNTKTLQAYESAFAN